MTMMIRVHCSGDDNDDDYVDLASWSASVGVIKQMAATIITGVIFGVIFILGFIFGNICPVVFQSFLHQSLLHTIHCICKSRWHKTPLLIWPPSFHQSLFDGFLYPCMYFILSSFVRSWVLADTLQGLETVGNDYKLGRWIIFLTKSILGLNEMWTRWFEKLRIGKFPKWKKYIKFFPHEKLSHQTDTFKIQSKWTGFI